MERIYRLDGLDCANCATKIERSVQQINGVEKAQVDFMSTKLTIVAPEKDIERISEEAKEVIHKVEPEVEVNNIQTEKKEENSKGKIIQIVVALVALGLLVIFSPAMPWKLIAYLIVYLWIGHDVLKTAITNSFHGEIFDENFLMAIATIGAIVIGEYPEAVAVMLFYQVGEFFQDYAVEKSRKSIRSLVAIRPDYANVIQDGHVKKVAPETIKVGDQILIKPGEKVPLDGIVRKGESMLDTSALTGESVPRSIYPEEQILSGFINQSGQLTVEVTTTFGESTVSKILDLVENASSKKAPAENFITSFARYYTPIVVGLAVLLAVVPPLVTGDPFYDWIYRALTFLVISCPCALVISVPLSFFGGIGGASKAGVLIKGSNYIETLANVETLVFDKTGTLTKGVFAVQKVETTIDQKKFLRYVASAEQSSSHPIAQSIVNYVDQPLLPVSQLEEIAGFGISVEIEGHHFLVGNEKLLSKYDIPFSAVDEIGTIVYVTMDGTLIGHLVIADELKENVAETLKKVKELGIKRTVMLTGDNHRIADAIGKKIGIDQVYSELLPEDKVLHLEEELQQKTAFVGDGMNDAPVLARSDIGIAMGGLGSDAAIEAADVVIMDDQPAKIPVAIRIARKTMKIVKQNIVFAIGIKIFVLILGALGFATMYAAVFADVGVTVIAVLNAMRCLKIN
ncbi:heavy metal translocating P-type ATPase [Enterococcus dongliensis]|uniref:Cd(2+)-exporting ATPase n=1 Tax=Enterococcus dongliensis TaxID=2559925 RepID=A0AAP5TZW1_9ENTE|nr:heavy metal translocating P-type ATPase [Enterococcus dongliensis]MDT2595495.1 heavy metal translocating P-type ATPase [Enterococcus dongliensis]MDT2603290.1 heavy metal translocating P-type ATPase [Enterococcus dongliensis]MDT2633652.1 heavy metal translocating P-type ATPase [Enterococcus dongliensis]MDT2635974.1 heavy metal translocating P-type ATPase [Enterococcus dongliensis]MDT2639752.1 heavy metal translocating P-type ATPase [Enterococcus dongliensis]